MLQHGQRKVTNFFQMSGMDLQTFIWIWKTENSEFLPKFPKIRNFAPCFENTRNKSFVKNVLIFVLSWRLSGESLEATIGQKKQISKCWTIIKMIFNHSLIIDPIALEFRFRQPTSAWPWHSFDLGICLTLSLTRVLTRSSESEVQKRKLLGWAKYFCGNVQD